MSVRPRPARSKLVGAGPTRLQAGSRILHVLEGAVDGHPVRIFDWIAGHASGSGRASLVFLHTVWAIPLPQVPFWAQAASKGQPHDGWRPGQVFRTGDDAFDAVDALQRPSRSRKDGRDDRATITDADFDSLQGGINRIENSATYCSFRPARKSDSEPGCAIERKEQIHEHRDSRSRPRRDHRSVREPAGSYL
ncbi:hypothetical protein E1295_00235 [Nonomuraea mesophila]|uniref:Uncharacterized protein n=1 Tax=Nonomuraea mesophila TaxID=2530382 RepID=A0A4R5FYH7_9ACTN|nr:hypothetical protein [Nonomuraea mesophila]TDE60311.1 hypothetical protein E1295_00235 [Nonomuraea mesophila]